MKLRDLGGLSIEALAAHRLRYGLSALAVAVGVGAVVLMSSIGEGARQFIAGQISMFGTTIVGVHPGRVETSGVPGSGGSARKLTFDDARALRRLPGVVDAVAMTYGTALVEYGRRSRRVVVYGATGHVPSVWLMPVAAGRFLPDLDWEKTSAVCVLGPRLKRELFGDDNALGRFVRIGRARFRVLGLMEPKGQYLGFDLDDAAFIPVANAMRLFNRSELAEIHLLAASLESSGEIAERARALMIRRHRGEEDVTIITQKDALSMVDNVMRVVSGTMTAIAAISLLVGAIGIFTILWIVVQERVHEVGLVKALGGTRAQILTWYLFEASLTAGLGGGAGLVCAWCLGWVLSRFVPGLTAVLSPGIAVAALVMALGVGLLAGVAPAVRAASLDPVEALRSE